MRLPIGAAAGAPKETRQAHQLMVPVSRWFSCRTRRLTCLNEAGRSGYRNDTRSEPSSGGPVRGRLPCTPWYRGINSLVSISRGPTTDAYEAKQSQSRLLPLWIWEPKALESIIGAAGPPVKRGNRRPGNGLRRLVKGPGTMPATTSTERQRHLYRLLGRLAIRLALVGVDLLHHHLPAPAGRAKSVDGTARGGGLGARGADSGRLGALRYASSSTAIGASLTASERQRSSPVVLAAVHDGGRALLAERELLPVRAGTAGRQMCLAQRLGDPIAGRALQGPGDGGCEINAVPHGHVHRLYLAPRSHGGTHRVSLVDQGRASAALRCERAVLADEDGLGAANGREVEQHAEVAG